MHDRATCHGCQICFNDFMDGPDNWDEISRAFEEEMRAKGESDGGGGIPRPMDWF